MPRLQLLSAKELSVGKQQWDCHIPHASCFLSPSLSGNTPAAQQRWGPNSKPLIHCCFQTVLKCPSYVVLPGGICLERSGADELSHLLSSGCSELAPHNCPGSRGRDARCGAGRSPKALGNGSVSVFWILTIKERTKKNQARWQLWLRLRIWETGMSMRDCMEEAGAVGDLWVQLRASLLDPGGGSGDETGLAWLSALVPKPLRKNAGCRRAGAGGSESRVGLALQGLHALPGSPTRELAECLWAKPPAGPSRPLPSPLSCLSTVLSSPGILSQETLPRGGKQSQAGQGKGLRPGGAQGSAGPSSRHSQPGERAVL